MRRLTVSLVAAAVLTTSHIAPAHAQEAPSPASSSLPGTASETTERQSISQAVYYDLRTDGFIVSEEEALALGYTNSEVAQFQKNLAALGPEESRELASIIGLDTESLKKQRAVPLVVKAIAVFLGGSAADEIIGQVTNWGVSGACRNLAGNWGAFDDFCRSNGHI